TAGATCNTNGACLPAEWTCDPLMIGDGECDCLIDCGTGDPDCNDASNPIAGCQDGQACSTDGPACKGVPPARTYDPSNGGDGVTGDSSGGADDADCKIAHGPTPGYSGRAACNTSGLCVPNTRTSAPSYYGGGENECGCGVADVHCPNANVS